MDVLRIAMSAHRHDHLHNNHHHHQSQSASSPTSSTITSPPCSVPPSPTSSATILAESPTVSFVNMPPELAARSLSRLLPSWFGFSSNNNETLVSHHPTELPAPAKAVEMQREKSLFSNLKGLGISGGSDK
ncbi:hypothetical protein BCR33DRAFT_717552 [Rhizoclosmatium globosum]|uniref:Uncharacterized protein n=1 Tax=Rhizoclosmatium globosum TaxID=329046 RepID=A0A1Y2C8G9_9FUNG|nr:hypothetical protein HDU79_002537 [Rhizoclosmatium sp. JEL0117]ORY43323.1 hypothetical protein BCR33DRAFT_717552 [Rhizoclosmatium globosum]|eukprot:ORY43323.1 hypothetical protein BCR33DRAFT_717552 [Rhizoclosmatium globosum]